MLTRRHFVRHGLLAGAGAAAAITPVWWPRPGSGPAPMTSAIRTVGALTGPIAYPFTLGIASGEPTPSGLLLWTRLAPTPLDEDGLGGMDPGRDVSVQWQVATDAGFADVVRSGEATAPADEAHTVHIEVSGLRPGREYWYRFRAGLHISGVGHTRTAPAPGVPAPLDFAATTCANFEHGYFTAYRYIAEAQPDIILNLGDYLYEYEAGFEVPPSGAVRPHIGERLRTLADYRLRHAQYKTDPDLQAAHAVAPWLVVPDDHEVANNWAGGHAWDPADQPRFVAMRTAAFRAYWEHMPLPRSARPSGPHMQLFRTVVWGRTAALHLLDTRQYRDKQVCLTGDQLRCLDRVDLGRSIMGPAQEKWLDTQLHRQDAVWTLLAQQVMYTPAPKLVDALGVPFAYPKMNIDCWDGYPGARARLLDSVRAADVRNLVILTGDVHSHWATDIHADLFADRGRPIGSELVTTSISTQGDGLPTQPWARDTMRHFPYLKYYDGRRGWVRCRASADELRADFHTLDRVSVPLSPAHVGASFVIEDGNPGLQRA
ncbi:MAG TPA: alkaline phosphatase D family protein [Sporichthyaceae bacterium]